MSPKPTNLWFIVVLIAVSQPWQSTAETARKVESISLSDIKSGAAKFNGQIRQATIEEEDAPEEAIFQQYGTRTFTAFEKHPELVASLKRLNPRFNPHTMGTSDLSGIATFEGRALLILAGCFPHNCGGTTQIVAFEPATKSVYLLQPTNVGPDSNPSGKFYVYGNPDSSVRAAMYSAYPD